jgi:hypothetical protein
MTAAARRRTLPAAIFRQWPLVGRAMPYYRIYTVTQDGHIQSAPVSLHCDSDRAVIERAEAMKDGLDLEVWQCRRRVAVLKGVPRD